MHRRAGHRGLVVAAAAQRPAAAAAAVEEGLALVAVPALRGPVRGGAQQSAAGRGGGGGGGAVLLVRVCDEEGGLVLTRVSVGRMREQGRVRNSPTPRDALEGG